MSYFYCTHCDRHCDSNEQDHADYSGEEIMCQDCVDKHQQHDGGLPKDDREDPKRVVAVIVPNQSDSRAMLQWSTGGKI